MINATALVTDSSQGFSLHPVVLPPPGKNEVLLRTAYSGVSIGTEFALIREKISWGPFPLVTGYMATGTIESVGSGVEDFKPGDRVYVRGNRQIQAKNGDPISAVSGTHCSHLVSSVGGTHGAALLPANADMETCSMFVMPAVGYHGVDMAGVGLGDTVVVYGAGLIGLGVVAAASLRGCKVVAVDVEDRQLKLAQRLGADRVVNSREEDVEAFITSLTEAGADAVFECTGIPVLIDQAIKLCRRGGKFIWQGNYGASPVSLSFLEPHVRQLTSYFPCDDGYAPSRTAVVKHMSSGILPWGETITHRVSSTEAPSLYKNILDGDRSIIGATISWE